MSKMPAISEIKNKILRSGRRAQSKYLRMTGGYGLAQAPESFLQNEIASALSNNFCPYVSLEDTLRTVIYESKNADLDGRKIRGNKSGRFDIILWPNFGKSKIAIEVKKCWNSSSCTEDSKRLRKYVNSGALKYGLIVAYMQAASKPTIKNRIIDVARETNSRVIQRDILGPIRGIDDDGTEWWWAIACYQISKSN